MFRKIEIWILFLTVLIFLIFTILFGHILRHHYRGGNDFSIFQNIAVFIAEIPSNTKRIIKGDFPPSLSRHQNKKKIEINNRNYKSKNLLLIPRFDGNKGASLVDLVNLSDLSLIHRYSINFDQLNNLIINNRNNNHAIKNDFKTQRHLIGNPVILDDASIIYSGDGALIKIDKCNNINWVNLDTSFHHSNFLSSNQSVWSSGKKDGSDSIVEVSLDGELIYNKSVPELLYENKIFSLSDIYTTEDPVHLNDIEEAFFDSKFWQKGDLFLSLRSVSAIVHYRPSENLVINYIKGPFYMQHDVDIISDHEISIFNNNNSILDDNKYSQVIIYNFKNKKFTKKFNDSIIDLNIKTYSQGLSEINNEGDLLIEEQNNGRLVLFDNKGQLVWEYLNKSNKGEIYEFTWSRLIKEEEKINLIFQSLSNLKCL